MGVVHPERLVPVRGGQSQVTIRPWSMAQRRLLRPLVEGVAKRISELRTKAIEIHKMDPSTFAVLFNEAEDEIYQIVKATLGWDDADMDALYWEDLPVLAQAILEICIIRADGGGMLGKLLGMLGRPAARSESAAGVPKSSPTSTPEKPSATKVELSPSSPEAGERIPSDFAGR